MAGLSLPLPRGTAPDGEVIAGIRPTDLLAEPEGDTPRLRAQLEVVERLGSESHLIFPVDAAKPGGQAAAATVEANENDEATLLADDDRARFTAVVPGRRRFTPGEVVELGVTAAAVHLFDPATGDALR